MATLKHSRQRDAIKSNLMHRRDHPTADMIYADIRKDYPSVSLGTVYRNLSLLTEIGEIQRLASTDGAVRYDGNLQPHDHFICTRCGRIADVEPADRTALRMQARQLDGIVQDCQVNYYGLCGDCKTQEAM